MFFPILIANKFLVSTCSIGNSSQQMSLQCLSMINMVFSDKNKILIKKTHKYTQNTVYKHRGIKIGAVKMQFVCIFFHICWISAKNEFLFPEVV